MKKKWKYENEKNYKKIKNKKKRKSDYEDLSEKYIIMLILFKFY